MHYSVCAVCSAYFTASTEPMVREAFKAHDCARRDRRDPMRSTTGSWAQGGPTMSPLEEANWIARQMNARGAKPVFV